MSMVYEDEIGKNLICRVNDVGNLKESICILALVITAMLLLVFICYRLIVLKKNRVPGSVLIVHALMLTWGVGIPMLTQCSVWST